MNAFSEIGLYISELLYKHDCVIVPGFGGFVARMQPSGFSAGNHVLYPPAKTVLFNKNLLHNDGLLAAFVMEKQQIDYSAAHTLLNDFTAYCKNILQAKKRLELDNLGLFFLDAEGTTHFEPRVDVNFLIDSFGLSPVSAMELFVEEPEPMTTSFQPVDRKPASTVIKTPALRPKRHYRRMAVMAVSIPVAMGILVLALKNGPTKTIWESTLNPFYTPAGLYTPTVYSPSPVTIPVASATELVADANGYATFRLDNGSTHSFIANISDTAQADKTLVIASFAKPAKAANPYMGKYQVVAGCFGQKENASRLIQQLNGLRIEAGISGLNKKGLHVVSCGGFNSREQAQQLLDKIRQSYPSAWLMYE